MYEGPAGSADKGDPPQLPVDAQKLFSTPSFNIYRSAQQQEIIINPTVYRAEQLHINAADLERLIAEKEMTSSPTESLEEIPERTQLYDKTVNWEVYAATEKVIIKPLQYHPGNLVLTFEDLRILRGISKPR